MEKSPHEMKVRFRLRAEVEMRAHRMRQKHLRLQLRIAAYDLLCHKSVTVGLTKRERIKRWALRKAIPGYGKISRARQIELSIRRISHHLCRHSVYSLDEQRYLARLREEQDIARQAARRAARRRRNRVTLRFG